MLTERGNHEYLLTIFHLCLWFVQNNKKNSAGITAPYSERKPYTTN